RVYGDGLTRTVVDHKNDAGVERHNRAQLIRDERNGIIHVERRTDGLRDLVKRENLTLGLGDRAEAEAFIRRSEQLGGETGVRFCLRSEVEVFGGHLLPNVFGGYQLVKFHHMLREEIYDLRMEGQP